MVKPVLIEKNERISSDGLSRALRYRLSQYHLVIGLLFVAFIGLSGILSSQKSAILTDNPDLCGIYCKMAIHYDQYVSEQSFDKYYFSKSLTSLIVHVGIKVGLIDSTPKAANLSLETLSLFSSLLGCFFWFRICSRLGFHWSAFVLGFVSFYLNQLFVWDIPLAQESPDAFALFFGLFFLHGLVAKNMWQMYSAFILSAFTQPQLSIFIVPTLLTIDLTRSKEDRAKVFPLNYAVAILHYLRRHKTFGISFYSVILLSIFIVIGYALPMVRAPYHGLAATLPLLMPLSILLASGLLAVGLWRLDLFGALIDICNHMENRQFWIRLAFLGFFFIAKGLLVGFVAQGEIKSLASTSLGSAYLMVSLLYLGIEAPLKSWVVHFVYWGPVVYYVSTRIGGLSKFSIQAGPGIVVAIALILLFTPNSESRHFVAFLPWLLAPALYANQGRVSMPFLIAYCALSAFSSRFFVDAFPSTHAFDPWLLTWGPWWPQSTYFAALLPVIVGICVLFGADYWSRSKRNA